MANTAVQVKERPIIMGAESVRAILEGRMTQTRRVVKPQSLFEDKDEIVRRFPNQQGCPHGQPGERLWVREAFAIESSYNVDDVRRYPPPHKDGRPTRYVENGETAWWEQCHYRATDPQPELCCEHESCDGDEPCARVWKTPLFMPRWASRITLELTAVRVERLNAISFDDVKAEGVPVPKDGPHANQYYREAMLDSFIEVWNTLNAKRGFGWSDNPFCWVLSFNHLSA